MHMIVLLLIIVIVIASIVWLVSARMHRANSPRLLARRSPGLEVLVEQIAVARLAPRSPIRWHCVRGIQSRATAKSLPVIA